MKATFRKLLDEEFAPYKVFRIGEYTVYIGTDLMNKKYVAYYLREQYLNEGEVGYAEAIGQDPAILDVKDEPKLIHNKLVKKYFYSDAFVEVKPLQHLINAMKELRQAIGNMDLINFKWQGERFVLELLGSEIVLSKLTVLRDAPHSIRVALKDLDLLTYAPNKTMFIRTADRGLPVIFDLNENEKYERAVLVFSQPVEVV